MGGPLGTLIVVVLKARNLPNKQRIGKQDPYATCTYLSHRKRTKTDKRGGQHPVWDDELRFDIYEHAKDAMASAAVSTTATGGVAPVKKINPAIGSAASAGVRDLRVAVYADDPRDPDLIGEGKVDLTDTLKKGEFDDWVTINNKGKYQGEVYLEMTFYSAKPPPEKLMTPTGPARAGVFEASSPHSVLRIAQQQPVKPGPHNGSHSSSPAATPTKKAEAWSVPPALRTGAPPSKPAHPRPSIGTLPLPGEPASVQHPVISSRQRSTGSLSMPTAEHPTHLAGSPSPSPSRNHHPYDQSAPLITALDKLSISTQPNPHDQHSSHGSPAELHPPCHPPHARPHRHSFSGHPHLPPPNLLHHSHSASPTNHDPPEPPDTRYQHPYPDHYPPASQLAPRVPITPRRPLPVPGGDSINRPTSAWGDYPPRPHGASSYSDAMPGSQPPPAGYGAHPHPGELERPVSRVSVPQTSPTGYVPPMQYGDGAGPSTGIPGQHPHPAYAEPPRHYHTPAPFVPGHGHSHSHGQHGAHFALPPPPAGQAPVPIHEVFGQPVPASAPPLGGYGSYGGFPAVGGEQAGYEGVYEGGGHERPFQTFQEQPYTVANAPPPPPPHLQQQLQYLPPPPVGGQVYYHQPGYAGSMSPQAPPGPGGGNGSPGGVYGEGEYGTYQHGQNHVGNGYAPRNSIGIPGQAPPPLPPPPPMQQQHQLHHPSYQHHQQQQQQQQQQDHHHHHQVGYPVAYRAPAQVAYPQT